MLECKNCAYCWSTEDDERPTCHWVPRAPGEVAPCDEEEDYEN